MSSRLSYSKAALFSFARSPGHFNMTVINYMMGCLQYTTTVERRFTQFPLVQGSIETTMATPDTIEAHPFLALQMVA